MFASKKIPISIYVLADWLGAIVAWLFFYGIRKYLLQESDTPSQWLKDSNLVKGIIVIPICWLVLYYLSGSYYALYKKSRLYEAIKLFVQAVVGCLFLFFFVLLDDKTTNYRYYLKAFYLLFTLHFCTTLFFKAIILTYAKWQINTGKFYYNTLLIGDLEEIKNYIQLAESNKKWSPYKIIGYLSNTNTIKTLPYFGNINTVEKVIAEQQIDEAIITVNAENTKTLKTIVSSLLGKSISIKLVPTEQDLISGAVKTNNVLGTTLVEIKNIAMPEWQQNFKRVLDICLALFLLIILSPLILYVAILTKLSNQASVIYTQQRLGYHGKPFNLYKFRSMVANAEPYGPQLSSETDVRITNWGKTMRKWRLDELPQLLNILKGEMSFVGPRPERDFFAKQLIEKNSYYKILYEMKPGLTSWGMVKYGYAENVTQMLERMQYDLVYANNASLLLDFKIMLHTLRIILLGKGM